MLKTSQPANKELRTYVKRNVLIIYTFRIDYLDKSYHILSDEPLRGDSMFISSSNMAKHQEKQKSELFQSESNKIPYFYFYKFDDEISCDIQD